MLKQPEEFSKKRWREFRECYAIDWHSLNINDELTQLQRMLCDQDIKTVLEIGTAYGGTALLWAKIVGKSGKVFCVDSNDHGISEGSIYKGTLYEDRITVIIGDSHEQATLEKLNTVMRKKQVDFLFIDGDHDIKGVEKDFIMYKELVREGGIIAIHDIASLLPGLWDRLTRTYRLCWEVVYVPDRRSNGIGIVKYEPGIEYNPKWTIKNVNS